MFKNLTIRRNNDFDLLQLGIGDFYRFWTEGQVEVGRSPAFFGAVLGCRFGMQSQHRREDIREQFPARNRSIASNGMEANPDRFLRQQFWVFTGFKGHRNGFWVGLFQLLLQGIHLRRCAI